MMKKILMFVATILLSINMLFLHSMPLFAVEEQMSNYEFLLNQGYPAEHLDNLTESSLQKMVEIIGDGYISDVEVQETVLNESNGVARASINESSMNLQLVTSAVYEYNTNKINGVLVSATWEWVKNKPAYRGKDGITINWDNNIFSYAEDSFYANDLYKSNVDDDWSVFKEYTKLAIARQGGIGHYANLKALKKYVGGSMLFLLDPCSPMIKGTKYKTTINIEYAHAPVPLTGLSFSAVSFGVGLSWNIACDTMSDSRTFKFSR